MSDSYTQDDSETEFYETPVGRHPKKSKKPRKPRKSRGPSKPQGHTEVKEPSGLR